MLTAISRYGARVLETTEAIAAGCKARGEYIQGPQIAEFERAYPTHKDAVGRTSSVTGTIVFANSQLQSVNVTADLQALKSDRAPRDSFLHSNALETDRYPTGTFQAVNPALPAPPPAPDR